MSVAGLPHQRASTWFQIWFKQSACCQVSPVTTDGLFSEPEVLCVFQQVTQFWRTPSPLTQMHRPSMGRTRSRKMRPQKVVLWYEQILYWYGSYRFLFVRVTYHKLHSDLILYLSSIQWGCLCGDVNRLRSRGREKWGLKSRWEKLNHAAIYLGWEPKTWEGKGKLFLILSSTPSSLLLPSFLVSILFRLNISF